MRYQTPIRLMGVLVILFLINGCQVPYTMTLPKSFKRYDSNRTFKLITPTGVRVRARQVDNYPSASLSFWKDAARTHLEKSGYNHLETNCFDTHSGQRACTLRFAVPRGAEDWIYQETLFLQKNTIVVVEAAGEFNLFSKIQSELDHALLTFRPNL